jgi:hypothetical protein
MQFMDEHTPAGVYTITETEPPVIAVPYPPNGVQPVNLPLRMALSRLVVGVITEDVITSQWHIVTSLVRRDQLEIVFPATRHALPWEMDGIDTLLREALCWLQGLR